jgi:hypothetical protein
MIIAIASASANEPENARGDDRCVMAALNERLLNAITLRWNFIISLVFG